jgi:hypothetical protein
MFERECVRERERERGPELALGHSLKLISDEL